MLYDGQTAVVCLRHKTGRQTGRSAAAWISISLCEDTGPRHMMMIYIHFVSSSLKVLTAVEEKTHFKKGELLTCDITDTRVQG